MISDWYFDLTTCRRYACAILNLFVIYIASMFYSYEMYYKPIKQEKIVEPINFKLEKPIQEEVNIGEEYKQEMKLKAFELVNKYMGGSGDCFFIATKFVKELKGINQIQLVEINENELVAGDIIYYSHSSTGFTHWAVYIDKEVALHGNFDGIVKIKKVHLENFAKPKFYKAIEKEE